MAKKVASYPTNTKKSGMLRSGHMTMNQGKMSSAHGVTNGGGKHKTLRNAEGAVGSKTRTFQKTFKETGC